MPLVSFTRNLQRHVPCPPCQVDGTTVQASLDQAFDLYPQLTGYVIDEHGAPRFHMAVFLDGVPIEDRAGAGRPGDGGHPDFHHAGPFGKLKCQICCWSPPAKVSSRRTARMAAGGP